MERTGYEGRVGVIEATLFQVATQADLKRQTKILVLWLIAAQVALFAALSLFLIWVLDIAPFT